MKILILRFSSIGDIVLTTPAIRCLKTQKKDTEIHFCTKQKYAILLESNPYISKIHLLEKSLYLLIRKLKIEEFDYIIDLHNDLRTFQIKACLRVKSISFSKMKINIQKWIYVHFKQNLLPGIHIVERYMKVLEKLHIKNDELGLDYFIPHKDKVSLRMLPQAYRKGYVVFAIGGQHQTKKLPFEKMTSLCSKINRPILLLGDEWDRQMGEKVFDFFKKKEKNTELQGRFQRLYKNLIIFNGCGRFNLNQSASLLQRAYCVFTHDTGLMHIASALKKKIFSIWGSTTPHFGMYPYKTEFVVFENKYLSCRPCSKIGYSKCPKKHFKCMNELSFDFYLPKITAS